MTKSYVDGKLVIKENRTIDLHLNINREIVGLNPLMRFYNFMKFLPVKTVAEWGNGNRKIVGSNHLMRFYNFIKQIIVICNDKELLGKI